MGADTMTYTQAPNPPASPAEGDCWWDSEQGRSFRWTGGKWLELFPPTPKIGPLDYRVESTETAD
jgi:hypothetical protein